MPIRLWFTVAEGRRAGGISELSANASVAARGWSEGSAAHCRLRVVHTGQSGCHIATPRSGAEPGTGGASTDPRIVADWD